MRMVARLRSARRNRRGAPQLARLLKTASAGELLPELPAWKLTDLAPTIPHLLGVRPPSSSRGGAMYDILEEPGA